MHLDPLHEYELEILAKLARPPLILRVIRWLKFLIVYTTLSGCIFSVLLFAVNFSAYSARMLNWMDPGRLEAMGTDMESVIARSSIEVSAAETSADDHTDSLEILEEKLAKTDPALLYSRSYSADRLLGSITETSESSVNFSVVPYENRILIPRIGKNIPLVDVNHDMDASPGKMHEVFMEELRKWVVRYPDTAKPGEVGNVFIFGHSSNFPWVKSEYNDVFALLDTLKDGDEVILFYNQKKYTYKITDRAIVKPGDVKVLNSRDHTKKELSLMTCWPVGTVLERIILFAELVE
jgi:LPXTG-site transpeptidase (sortase) family protein